MFVKSFVAVEMHSATSVPTPASAWASVVRWEEPGLQLEVLRCSAVSPLGGHDLG